MMAEISLNILDVAENSVRAKAALIEITVSVNTKEDTLTVVIKDDGCGMTADQVKRAQDPFFTTRTTRIVGLGLPFFKQAAESTGGTFSIDSEKGIGTIVKAVFILSHIDRMPLGDISSTIRWSCSTSRSILSIPMSMTIRVLHWIPEKCGRCWAMRSHLWSPRYLCLSGNIWIRTNMRQTAELIFETM